MARLGRALAVVVLALTPLPATAISPPGLPPASLSPAQPTLAPGLQPPNLPAISPPALPSILPSAPGLPAPPAGSVPTLDPITPGGATSPPSGGGPTPSQVPKPAPGSKDVGGVSGIAAAPRPLANARPVPTAPARFVALPSNLPLPSGPAGTALAVALMLLPTLVVIWLLVLLRTLQKTGAWRGSALRLAIAAELGVRPKDLAAMPPSALRALREQLAFDEVTRVLNRPAGLAALDREIARAKRRRLSLAVAFVDVDGLKQINDSHGHAAGDELLHRVGGVLTSGLRAEDLVFRFGGDEFVCVLPGSSAADAEAVMTRIATEAASQSCGFSFGVGEMRPGDDEVDLLGRADKSLYEAKRARPSSGRPAADRDRLEERLEQGSRRLRIP